MRTYTKCLLLFTVAALILTTSITAPQAQEQHAALQGVWRTVEVTVAGSPGGTFRPAATLAIFHGRHFSRVEVHAGSRVRCWRIPHGVRRRIASHVGTIRR
jgi:hypothetical protein